MKPVDHSTLPYKPFNKTFYKEHSDVSSLTPKQVFEFRMEHEIRVFGHDAPKPVQLVMIISITFITWNLKLNNYFMQLDLTVNSEITSSSTY